MSLTVLTYNLKRGLNIVGVERLLEVLRERRNDSFTIIIQVSKDRTRQCHRFWAVYVLDFSHSLALHPTLVNVAKIN